MTYMLQLCQVDFRCFCGTWRVRDPPSWPMRPPRETAGWAVAPPMHGHAHQP